MKEESLIEMMKQMEKELPLYRKIKLIPWKIWAWFYVFFNLSLPNLKYKVKEYFCDHKYNSASKDYHGNYKFECSKCGKLK